MRRIKLLMIILADIIPLGAVALAQDHALTESLSREVYFHGVGDQYIHVLEYTSAPDGRAITYEWRAPLERTIIQDVDGIEQKIYLFEEAPIRTYEGHIDTSGERWGAVESVHPEESGSLGAPPPGGKGTETGQPGETASGGKASVGTGSRGWAVAGNFILSAIRIGGDEGFLVARTSVSAAQQMSDQIAKVGAQLGKLSFVSSRLDAASGSMSGALVRLPPDFATAAGDALKDVQAIELPHYPLTMVKTYDIAPRTEAAGIRRMLDGGDLEALREHSEMLATQHAALGADDALGPLLQDGVLQMPEIEGATAPFNGARFATSPDTIHGMMVRRAANATQVAWGNVTSGTPGRGAEAVVVSNTGLIRIADARLGSGAPFDPGLYKEAEGILFAAEHASGFISGAGQGLYDYVLDTAEAIYSVPEMGEHLFDYMKYAYQNPARAAREAMEILEQTPEFATGLYNRVIQRIEEFPQLSAYEKGRFVGEVAGDVVASIAGGGVVGGLNKAKQAAKVAKATSGNKSFVRSVIKNTEGIAEGVDGRNTIFAPPGDYPGDFPDFDSYASSFTNGVREPGVVKSGSIVVQGQASNQEKFGHFFGSRERGIPVTSKQAEKYWEVRKYNGKIIGKVKGYLVVEDLPVYYGGVAEGIGDQFVVPKSVDLKRSLKEVFSVQVGN